jgi:phosphoribosylaminoimidazole carboxylase (NCAIR synthetase)
LRLVSVSSVDADVQHLEVEEVLQRADVVDVVVVEGEALEREHLAEKAQVRAFVEAEVQVLEPPERLQRLAVLDEVEMQVEHHQVLERLDALEVTDAAVEALQLGDVGHVHLGRLAHAAREVRVGEGLAEGDPWVEAVHGAP